MDLLSEGSQISAWGLALQLKSSCVNLLNASAVGQLREDPKLLALVSEVTGLLDVLTGINLTNPEERTRAHCTVINKLVQEIEERDGSNNTTTPMGGDPEDPSEGSHSGWGNPRSSRSF